MLPLTQSMKAPLSATSAFKTHLNYIKYIDTLLSDCTINIRIKTKHGLNHKKTKSFESLARITQQSIDNEMGLIAEQADYAQIVAPWLPVKCYYHLYYLESILSFMICDNLAVFKQGGHLAVRNSLKNHLETNAIAFNIAELNDTVALSNALSYRGAVSANIRNNYHASDDCGQAILKKLAQYIESNFKERKTIENYWLTKDGRSKRQEFLQREKIALIDYFYWMRIKANYKDVDFLDFDNIRPFEVVEYLKHYVSAVDKYAYALNGAIAKLRS